MPLPMFLFNLYALQSFQSVLGIRNTCPLEGGYLQFCSIQLYFYNSALYHLGSINSLSEQFFARRIYLQFFGRRIYLQFCSISIHCRNNSLQGGYLQLCSISTIWKEQFFERRISTILLHTFFCQKNSFLKYGLYEDRNTSTT